MARATTGTARQLHLARTARVAGEAFAFVEADTATRRSSRPGSLVLVWAALGAVAAGALWFGF